MKIDYLIGIDPGKSGGIAVINVHDHTVTELRAMPDSTSDLARFLACLSEFECFAYLERVWSQPSDGSSRAFEFGRNYGQIEAVLITLKIPHEKVVPQKWQKIYSLERATDKAAHKRALKIKAQELFPDIKGITLKTADALLIAEYGYRQQIKNK